jgi:hypothetical protein
MLGEDYENKWEKAHNMDLSNEISRVEPNKE